MLLCPRKPLSSDPQMPEYATRTTTSPGPAVGAGSVRITMVPGPSYTRALIVGAVMPRRPRGARTR